MIESTENAKPVEYTPIEISIFDIKRMIKKGEWEGSIEQEEVMHNLIMGLYREKYAKKVRAILKLK